MPNQTQAVPEPEKEYDPERWWEEVGENELLVYPRRRQASQILNDAASILAPMSTESGAGDVWLGLLNELKATKEQYQADPIDGQILSLMKLAEYFVLTEGDIWQTVIAPLDIGLKNLNIDCKDQKVKNEFEDLFDVDMLDIEEVLWNIALCTEVYGNCYPLELWDGDVPKEILIPNPKHVGVGKISGFGVPSLSLRNDVAQALLESQSASRVPMVYNGLMQGWNEHAIGGGAAAPLDMNIVTHIHHRKLRFQRYAIPPVTRATKAILLRNRHEEMTLATVEGIKNQLWVFKLKDPARGEIKALRDHLSGGRGDRTGYLIWKDNLTVEQHLPGSVDALLANESWMRFTLHIFRQLGISLRIISGEAPGGQGRGQDAELDIKILIERLDYLRNRQLRWLRQWAKKYADKQRSKAMMKNLPTFRMADISIEIEDVMRNRVIPLLGFGGISFRTALKEAGYDVEAELSYKEQELENAHLWVPNPGFAQTTRRAGMAPTETMSPLSPGRTPDVQQPPELSASRYDYAGEIEVYFDELASIPAGHVRKRHVAVEAFIASLKIANGVHMRQAYREGYASGAGPGEPDPELMEAAVLWANEHVMRFAEALDDAVDKRQSLEKFRQRAGQYASEGWRYASLAGLREAKERLGLTGYKRIYDPKACPSCKKDSEVIHSIKEPIMSHVGCTCEQPVFLSFYRDSTAYYPVRTPPFDRRFPHVDGKY